MVAESLKLVAAMKKRFVLEDQGSEAGPHRAALIWHESFGSEVLSLGATRNVLRHHVRTFGYIALGSCFHRFIFFLAVLLLYASGCKEQFISLKPYSLLAHSCSIDWRDAHNR